MSVQIARIEPLVELVDRLALAGSVGAGDHYQHREAATLEQLELGIEQRLARPGLGRLVARLV